jgi:hypothetical protein
MNAGEWSSDDLGDAMVMGLVTEEKAAELSQMSVGVAG